MVKASERRTPSSTRDLNLSALATIVFYIRCVARVQIVFHRYPMDTIALSRLRFLHLFRLLLKRSALAAHHGAYLNLCRPFGLFQYNVSTPSHCFIPVCAWYVVHFGRRTHTSVVAQHDIAYRQGISKHCMSALFDARQAAEAKWWKA